MRRLFLLLVLLLTARPSQTRADPIVFKDCLIVDGSGLPAFEADVRVDHSVILQVGQVTPQPSDRIVQCQQQVLAPGFVDLHNHSQQGLLDEPEASSQVSQGITTLLIGPDGGSPFPLADYRRQLRKKGIAVNVGLLVGHGTIRRLVLGEDFKRAATPAEIQAMAALVGLAMRQGAFGLSAGLEYDPGFYSHTEELIALARQAAAFGGFYMPHIRDEEDGIFQALEETLQIARKASVAVHISHLKLGNQNVAGRTSEVLALVERAGGENLDLTADCYPYTAWASSLGILVPSRRFQDPHEVEAGLSRVGGAEKVLITRYSPDFSFEFKTLAEIAAERQQSPALLFMEMMRNGGAGIVGHSMDEADVHAFYRHPQVMVASDGGLDSRHPRKAGTFPRVLAHMVRETGILSLEAAIHKMSEQPAKRLGLVSRGLIRPGYRADLVLLSPQQVRDQATFQEPNLLSEGIDMTLVNGVVVWESGQTTGKLPGEMIEN